MLNLNLITLGSSNPGKIREYTSFGLNLKSTTIPDLPEVLGTEEEVIIYKALSAGENILVEDTSLTISGFDVGINIKYLTEDLKTNPKYHGSPASWKVFLGVVQGQNIYLAQGEVKGSINSNKAQPTIKTFGFDSIFVPDGQLLSLHELSQKSQKDAYSARKIAIMNLMKNSFYKIIPIDQIPQWTGTYQES